MKSIISLFILFLSFNLIYSVEDQCFTNLFSKIDDYNFRGKNSTNDACSVYITFNFVCDSQGYITSLPLSDSNIVKNLISWSDLSCFSKLNELYIDRLLVTPDFLYTINKPLYRLKIGQSNIYTINNTIPVKIDNLTFSKLSGTAKASYLKNIRSFDAGYESPFNLEVDGDQINSDLFSFSIASTNIPNLSTLPRGLYCNLKFFMPINESTLPNLDSFLQRCSSITFSATSDFYFNFPKSFTSLTSPYYNSLTFGNNMKVRTNHYIDFSNHTNEKGSYSFDLVFSYTGEMFNGSFPFISFPKNFKNFRLDLYDNKFDYVPDLQVFKNLSSISTTVSIRKSGMGGNLPANNGVFNGLEKFIVYQNKINGTLDKSWCNGVELDVSENQMSGNLPLCYYCYLDLETVKKRFKLNNFTNYHNTDRSQCNYETIIPNIRLLSNVSTIPSPSFTSINIYGDNLGYDTSNIVITPTPTSISYTSYGNLLFVNMYNPPATGLVKKMNMTIKSLNLTYTLSISNTPPIINQMIQNNDTLTFIGEYFTYNSSDTTIIIDNYQECYITKTTFYRIECVLDRQLRDRGLRPTNVTVKGLTTIVDLHYEYIVYPCYCNQYEFCNSINGTCICNQGYTSSYGYPNCSIPDHFISGVLQVPSSIGGDLILIGWFGSLHDQLSIKVGSYGCTIKTIDNKVIICSIPSGTGAQIIKVAQNNYQYSKLFSPYYELPTNQLPSVAQHNSNSDDNSDSGDVDYQIISDAYISLSFPLISTN